VITFHGRSRTHRENAAEGAGYFGSSFTKARVESAKESATDFLAHRSFLDDCGFLENTSEPSKEVLRWLKTHGIPFAARVGWDEPNEHGLVSPSPLRVSKVKVDGIRFTFDPDGHAAFVVAEYCGGAAVDVVAFHAAWQASLRSRAAILGEDVLSDLPLDEPIQVHRNGIDWMSNNRNGIVIINPSLAALRLAHKPIVAADIEHGSELRRSLSIRPRILIPRTSCKAERAAVC
jgi:hypothetical protein